MNGDKYIGQFRNDTIQGMGKKIYNNGDWYEGPFLVNKPEGIGVMTLKDGAVYKGEFKKGLYDGKGQLILANGDVHTGDFKDNKLAKGSILLASDGRLVEGEFGHLYFGNFTVTLKNTGVYYGGLKYGSWDIPEGMDGELKFPDGTVYKGKFKDNLPKVDDQSLETLNDVKAYHKFLEASASFQAKEYAKAITSFTECLSYSKKFPGVYFHRGQSYKQLNDFTKALADFDQAKNLAPTWANPVYEKMEIHLKQNKFADALAAANQLVAIAPNSWEVYYQRARVQFSEKKYDLAIADCNTAISKDYKAAEAYMVRGNSKLAQSEALLNSKDTSGYSNLFSNASSDIDLSVYYKNTCYPCAVAQAQVKLFKKDYTGAIYNLNMCLQVNPEDLEVLQLIAKSYHLKGDATKACLNWKKAMDLGDAASKSEWKANCK